MRVSWLRAEMNRSPVLLHDSLDGIESESGPFPYALGGEERLENVRLDLGRNSGAGVGNLHHDARVFAKRTDAQFAFSIHRVDRVVHEVGPNLVQFAAKGVHQKWPLL